MSGFGLGQDGQGSLAVGCLKHPGSRRLRGSGGPGRPDLGLVVDSKGHLVAGPGQHDRGSAVLRPPGWTVTTVVLAAARAPPGIDACDVPRPMRDERAHLACLAPTRLYWSSVKTCLGARNMPERAGTFKLRVKSPPKGGLPRAVRCPRWADAGPGSAGRGRGSWLSLGRHHQRWPGQRLSSVRG